MSNRNRTSRRTILFALAAVTAALVPWTAAFADANGAAIDKTGWWARANTQTSTPAGPVTVPPPPGIPDGDLAVGTTPAEPSAILAVGIQPDDDPGATVTSFTLTMTEDPDANGNQGTEAAAILACPITEFWAGGGNGTWDTRPAFDCDAASAPGERDDEGVWTFDLAPIGSLWFDPFGTIIADGVVLIPDPEATTPFQAVFLGGDEIDVDLQAQAAPGGGDDPFATPTTFADAPSDAGFNTGGSGGSDSLFSPPVVTSPPTTLSTPEPDIADDSGDETAPPAIEGPAAEPVASRAGELFGNLPLFVLLAFPLLLGLLLVISYWFGAAGQAETTIRQRGVSRALEARARASKGL